jgi:hypothetical protein
MPRCIKVTFQSILIDHTASDRSIALARPRRSCGRKTT